LRIHFFLSRGEVPEDLTVSWNPDLEPWRYSSGLGHNILEFALRLEMNGHEVSYGHEVPSGTYVVIFFKKHFLLQKKLSPTIFKIAMKYPVILIRSDLPIEYPLIFIPDLEVMPNRLLAKNANQVFIPPIPQRGLIARDEERRDQIVNLTIKCNPENVPSSAHLILDQLKVIDPRFSLVIDSPEISDGSDNNWNDFSQVDISLILRPLTTISNDRKPPTRLINAWVAGTIPFVDPLPAYLELIRDGVDGFVIRETVNVASVMKVLVDNPEYRSEVFANARKRGEEFTVEKVIEEWERSISEICRKTKLGLNRRIRIILQFARTIIQR